MSADRGSIEWELSFNPSDTATSCEVFFRDPTSMRHVLLIFLWLLLATRDHRHGPEMRGTRSEYMHIFKTWILN